MKPPISNGTYAAIDSDTSNQADQLRLDKLLLADNPSVEPVAVVETHELPQETSGQSANPLVNNLIFLLVGCLLTYAATFLTRQPDLPAIQIQPPPTVAPTPTPLPTATAEPMTVFVSGAVQNPGLYPLPHSARVGDALAVAGGLLPDADSTIINQAEHLFDGAQVHVPEVIELTVTEFDSGQINEESPPLLLNQPPAGISGSTQSAQMLSATGNAGLINVNTASATELETLPGVGASRAAEIIAGRPYATVEDLQKVSGIGVKTVDKLRPLVTVD